MKPAISLITLSFLLFAFFSTKLPSASAADEQVVDINGDPIAEQVVDINGDPIFPAFEYYIVSAIRGAGGGGVRPGKTGNSTYPVSVIQEPSDLNKGVPVKFTIPEISPGIIFTGTHLEVAFTKKPHQAESGKWVVVTDSKTAWVGIGGAKDHPGKKLVSGDFSIGKSSGKAYDLVFRPTKTPRRSIDIGRKTVDGKRLLVLTPENPFQVVFIKANRVDAAIKSIIEVNAFE